VSRFPGRRARYDAAALVQIDPATTGPTALWAGTITTGATFTWSDLSGNGNDLVQSTVGAQPTKNNSSATFNGQPSISFAGAHGLGTAGNVSLGTTFEFVFVVNITGAATTRIVWETSTVGAGSTVGSILIGYNWTAPAGSGYSLLIHGSVGNNWQAVNAPSGPSVVAVAGDLTASPDGQDFRYDNVKQTVVSNAGLADNSAALVALPLFLGSRAGTGGVAPITGEFAFAALWTRARSEAERASVNAFLRSKYGV